jgi:hypothetical protein
MLFFLGRLHSDMFVPTRKRIEKSKKEMFILPFSLPLSALLFSILILLSDCLLESDCASLKEMVKKKKKKK